MKQEAIFKKIGAIVGELNDHYHYLAQNPDQLNHLEVELLYANTSFLLDHVQILNKLMRSLEEASSGQEQKVVQSPTIPTAQAEWEGVTNPMISDSVQEEEKSPAIEEIEEEVFKLDHESSAFEFILNDHSEQEKFDFEDKSVDEIFNRPLSEEEEFILAQKSKVARLPIEEVLPLTEEEEEEEEVGPEPFLVTKPISALPLMEQDTTLQEAVPPVVNQEPVAVEDPGYRPTLNDILAGKSTKTQERSQESNSGKSVSDLRQAISLNDKLLYIKELFNGYNLAYGEAIDFANKLSSFEAADNFFQKNYAAQYNWADKQATVDKFYQLLNQRFRS